MQSTAVSPNALNTPANSTWHILLASLIGTTIEFFDFYIYATAAVLVFPALFFPKSSHSSAVLESLATFALAFFARPIGSAIFGHFGDRIGRKATLVAALLTMGISTVMIGILPTYATIGIVAPALLALCRLGQGLGLGGEWGGAVLLATENAPPGKRAWFGMFPQLGAPIGFLFATLVFLALAHFLNDAQFLAWGWRIPFLCSAVLIAIGLWVRLKLTETPEFQRVLDHDELERVPVVTIFKKHPLAVLSGTFAMLATFVLFYLMTVFALSWGTSKLGYTREQFLLLQMASVVFFGIFIPIGAIYAGRIGTRGMMIVATVMIMLFGLAFAPLLASGSPWRVLIFLSVGMMLTGLTYGPCGTLLAEMFPAKVRYTGASLSFNLAGIFGASLAPYIATKLASNYGVAAVGAYLCIAAIITLGALLTVRINTNATDGLDGEVSAGSIDGIIPEA
ncbi:MAG: MFS transporter [Abditibacteriaceae bacterium]